MASLPVDPSKVHTFADAKSFYAWLRKHGKTETEVWIKIRKVKSGLVSITPTEAIDAALCWGWIDGIRKSFDDKSFLQRYTPRGKKSVWSQVNVANVARLIEEEKMQPAGLAHVEAAKADGRWDAAYGTKTSQSPPDLLAAIQASPKAQAMYEALSAQNRFALTFRTVAMKTEAGRRKKVATFVTMLERGETIYPNGNGPRKAAQRLKPRAVPKVVHEGRGGYIAIDAGGREHRYPIELIGDGRFSIHYPAGNRVRDQAAHLAALEAMCRAEPQKWSLERRDRGGRSTRRPKV